MGRSSCRSLGLNRGCVFLEYAVVVRLDDGSNVRQTTIPDLHIVPVENLAEL